MHFKMLEIRTRAHVMQGFNSFFIYVLPLEIQLSSREDWDSVHQFNTATCVYYVRTWIFNIICRDYFHIQWVEVKCDCLLCWFGAIVDHHCLKALWFVMQGPVAIILISWNVIFIWETGYWTRAMIRIALFDLLKSLYSDTKILSKYIPSLQKIL